MKPIAFTLGEPAGIGPDLLIQWAQKKQPFSVLAIGCPQHLALRAQQLSLPLDINLWQGGDIPPHTASTITLCPIAITAPVVAGQLNPKHGQYVVDMLRKACDLCLQGVTCGVVTGPVHKANINAAGIAFSGQTEFFAKQCGVDKPVMMLANQHVRVALVTTHLALREVPLHITTENIESTVRIVHQSLQQQMGIGAPKLLVCGLNPHAGEDGYLGREEIDIINPCLRQLQQQGMDVSLAMPADTLFTPQYLKQCDAVIAMYHDQGLPVIKSMGFGATVNITLGLPIIRVSVDHGTALSLAGSGKANIDSLDMAFRCFA